MRPTTHIEVPPDLVVDASEIVETIKQLAQPTCPGAHWDQTPERFARYLYHLARSDEYDRWTTFVHEQDVGQLITVAAIDFWSACSHHMLPFIGKCWIGYVPKGRIIGLSKIPLLVREIARGFWVQEDLTTAIVQRLEELLSPAGIGVHIRAKHTCQLLDVGPPVPDMITTELHGLCLHGPAKDEFLGWCHG